MKSLQWPVVFVELVIARKKHMLYNYRKQDAAGEATESTDGDKFGDKRPPNQVKTDDMIRRL